MNNDLFTTDQEELSKESWRLLLKQPTEKEKFDEKQREILRGVFE
jgi:hypothetical protein